MSKQKSEEIGPARSPQSQEEIMANVIINGDLSGLNKMQQIDYYNYICNSLGLNPLTKPFDYLTIDGKVVLYARKDCTEQLRKIHKISLKIIREEAIDGILVATCEATLPNGRSDADIGAVSIKGEAGKSLANCHMKAVTKAKRRVTLSICGLGVLDESEIEGIDSARIMTDRESLVLRNYGAGLDQWICGRGLAMKILDGCKAVEEAGVTEAEWRGKLPEGITTRKELTPVQAEIFIQDLRNLWSEKKSEAVSNV